MDIMRIRHRQRGERGAAAVEFALVLPLLLLIVFGLVQYGWLFYQVQETSYAVREGARVAAVGSQNSAGVQALVIGKIPSASTTPAVLVCYTETSAPTGLSIGDQITVTATLATTDFNFPFVPFPSTASTNTQTAQTRTENVVAGTSNYGTC